GGHAIHFGVCFCECGQVHDRAGSVGHMHHRQAILSIANDMSRTMCETCDILLSKHLARPIDQVSEVDVGRIQTRSLDQLAYRDANVAEASWLCTQCRVVANDVLGIRLQIVSTADCDEERPLLSRQATQSIEHATSHIQALCRHRLDLLLAQVLRELWLHEINEGGRILRFCNPGERLVYVTYYRPSPDLAERFCA